MNSTIKSFLVLILMITLVSAFGTTNATKKVEKKYQTPKEVLDALNKVMVQLDQVKKRLPTQRGINAETPRKTSK